MLSRIVPVSVVTFLLICCSFQVFGIKLVLETFEQTLGQDIVWLDLRVRKYNRTTTVINGTIHVLQEGTNDHQFRIDIFYSRLGNQQYNHMPIKLPTAGICDFMDHLHKNYKEYMLLFRNAPEIGECPISVRGIDLLDVEFPTEVIPQVVLRNGLWKALLRCFLQGKEVISYYTVFKAIDN